MRPSTGSVLLSSCAAATAVLLLLVALHAPVAAQDTPAAPLVCEDGDQPGGARFRICMPAVGWNGDLLVYAHGYVSPYEPVGIPEEQLSIGGVNLADVVTLQGYAFAATSYRRNGLAIVEGVDDLVELVALFGEKHAAPDRVVLAGVSEGGAIAVHALERHPDVFDGGLALCGPYGSFQGQVDYFTDFRVVFDRFFPGLIAGTPISITGELTSTWETSYYSNTVLPAILNAANAISVAQVISVTGAPVDASVFPTSTEPTFNRLLWYNIISTNDARRQLGGNPYGNIGRVYSGSLDDSALNQGLFRVAADPAAVATIQQQYETSGNLRVPLITLHTTGDEITPYWHATVYQQRVDAAGRGRYYEHRAIQRAGHCNFVLQEVQSAFAAIVERANARSLYLPAVSNGAP